MTEVVTLAPGPAEFKKALRTSAALDTLGNAVEVQVVSEFTKPDTRCTIEPDGLLMSSRLNDFV